MTLAALLSLVVLNRWPCGAFAQLSSTTAVTVQVDLRGRVLNAVTGAAVPRALVSIGQRSVLTDGEGHFSFPNFSGTTASYVNVRVTKPGFTQSLDPDQQQSFVPLNDLTEPMELRIYPDCIVSGTVTAQDGTPVGRAQLMLLRAQYSVNGLRAVNSNGGISSTNAEGQFRLRVPPGRYRLSLRYNARVAETDKAVLPQSFPTSSATSDAGFFSLEPGEEKTIDLHPRIGPAYTVTLHSEAGSVPEEQQGGISLTVTTASGETFPAGARPGPGAGEYRVQLPSGSYVLKATRRNGVAVSEGVTKVTVAGHDVEGVPLQLGPLVTLPVEIALDPAMADTSLANTETLPKNAVALGLRLHALTGQAEGLFGDVGPTPTADGGSELRVSSGRYQLQASLLGQWYIVSATYGAADLMRDDLVVGPGAAGAPVRLIVSNQRGQLSGVLQGPAPAGGSMSGVSIYFLPQFPCLQSFVQVRVNYVSGNWATSLPPGKYVAVALDHTIQADLHDPAVSGSYARLGTSVEVTAGGKETLNVMLANEGQKAP